MYQFILATALSLPFIGDGAHADSSIGPSHLSKNKHYRPFHTVIDMTPKKLYWDTSKGIIANYGPEGNYTIIIDELEAAGHQVSIGTTALDTVDLDAFDVVILNLGSNWYSPYSAAEATVATNYVARGGGLMIMSDNPAFPNENFEQISSSLGFTLAFQSPKAAYEHPVQNGVEAIRLVGPGLITVSEGLELFDGHVGVRDYDKGYALVIGDINWLTNIFITDDNRRFFQNAIAWLSSGRELPHNCLTNSANKLRCMGDNKFGQLGQGDAANRGDGSEDITSLSDIDFGSTFGAVVSAADGEGFSCAVGASGAVKCWGRNDKGQLHQGDSEDRGLSPEQLGDSLRAIPLESSARKVVAGSDHACALLGGGQMACWGDGQRGQLGGTTDRLGDETEDVVQMVALPDGHAARDITVGKHFSCVLTDADKVFCWGRNDHGQLGVGSTATIGTSSEQMGNALIPVNLPEVAMAELAAGESHMCALSQAGQVFCWGQNDKGQLGLGHSSNIGSSSEDVVRLVDLGAGQVIQQLACGSNHCCARSIQNTMKCWGANSFGQLGMGHQQHIGTEAGHMGDGLVAVDFGALTKIKAIDLHGSTSCGQTDRGWVCFGNNTGGQLGQGDTIHRGNTPRSIPRYVSPIRID